MARGGGQACAESRPGKGGGSALELLEAPTSFRLQGVALCPRHCFYHHSLPINLLWASVSPVNWEQQLLSIELEGPGWMSGEMLGADH